MDMSPEKYVNRLTELSVRKYELLKDILLLTEEQTQLLEDENLDRLKKILAGKQAKMNEIDTLDEEFSVYFKRLKLELKVKSLEEIKSPGIPGAAALKDIVGSIVKLTGEISGIDALNTEKADSILIAMGGKIAKYNRRNTVNRAYSPNGHASRFFDKKK